VRNNIYSDTRKGDAISIQAEYLEAIKNAPYLSSIIFCCYLKQIFLKIFRKKWQFGPLLKNSAKTKRREKNKSFVAAKLKW
jgi:hypothetical protein